MKKRIRRKKWHKISEETPEIDDDYIIWGKKIGIHCALYIKDKGFIDYEHFPIEDASHWHPLPSEPKHKDR